MDQDLRQRPDVQPIEVHALGRERSPDALPTQPPEHILPNREGQARPIRVTVGLISSCCRRHLWTGLVPEDPYKLAARDIRRRGPRALPLRQDVS
jgi:hypothetical protein